MVLETLFSGVTELPFTAFLGLMQPIHLAIGLVEGLVTAAILSFVWKLRPELLEAGRDQAHPTRINNKPLIAFAVLALLVAGCLSLLASGYPDGLEWSIANVTGSTELQAADTLHQQAAAVQANTALLPDYDYAAGEGALPGVTAAGLLGCCLTVTLALGSGALVRLVKKRRKAAAQS